MPESEGISDLKAYSEVFGFTIVIAFFAFLVARAYVLYFDVSGLLNQSINFGVNPH